MNPLDQSNGAPEAFKQWLESGTVSDVYVECVLGHPLRSVAPPNASGSETVIVKGHLPFPDDDDEQRLGGTASRPASLERFGEPGGRR